MLSAKTVCRTLALSLSLGLLLTGCSHSLSAPVQRSSAGELEPTRIVFQMDESGEVLLGAPAGSTTSEVALARASDGEICIDVLFRTWRGAAKEFEVLVNVDQWNVFDGQWTLNDCQAGWCLPKDSVVLPRPSDGILPNILTRGGRFCQPGPRPTESVVVELVQGAASIDATFEIATASPAQHAQR